MRLLFLGDVVGRVGRRVVGERLSGVIARLKVDVTVVNGENAAGGFGITERIYKDLRDAGVDAVTLGNHAFDQQETARIIGRCDALVRPVNFPQNTPGVGATRVRAKCGRTVLVVNAIGRLFMDSADDPFAAIDRVLAANPLKKPDEKGNVIDAVVIDFHAEATSEKQAFGYHVDGRASLLAGTHTHVPTADHRILPAGTAYISDAGMCGDYQSVLGMERAEAISRFVTRVSRTRLAPASGEATLSGVLVETDDNNGLAHTIEPIRVGANLDNHLPKFGPCLKAAGS